MKNLFLALMACLTLTIQAQTRTETTIDRWQFSRDKTTWHDVSVPHDWAINGPFDKQHDLQYVAIEQNGETEKTEKSGRSGALPWIGQGYYRTTITLPADPQHATLLFDGAMSEPVVTVNGQEAGRWAYGYNAFRVDATPYLHAGENTIEVALNNREESSRWYPGGGIYRPVTLQLTPHTHIDTWQSYCRTIEADSARATMVISTQIVGYNPSATAASITTNIIDREGRTVATITSRPDANGLTMDTVVVSSPHLWSPETPYLYRLVTTLNNGSQTADRTTQRIGIRTVDVSKEHGFRLNGQTRKLKGVCLHHDLGPLGAAINKAALTRQLITMKEMGADAIRTAHNMPSTWQMELCDSLGLMVMAESFDMWIYPKCKNGYARFFNEWSDCDITNLILCHRNHPSIVMWSIGNEIPEQWSDEGRAIAKHLQDLCHNLDPTRPVTQGMDKAEEALNSGFAQTMDVPGFNYRVHKYEKSIGQLPQGFLLGSETASTVSSRGVYKFPVSISNTTTYPDGQCSSYDTEYCSWSNLPEDDFMAQDDLSYTIGQFVWTGYDYLGEPTPYDNYWPSRSSYFGICDLAGLPKDRYYLYRSQWRTDSHTLHLLPHWTWPEREGLTTPVYCYTSYPSAELFVNGQSQGRRFKQKDSVMDRYRLRWNDVVYHAGEITVVAYDAQSQPADTLTIRTAGTPTRLALTADRTTISSTGHDLVFITVQAVDNHGTPCPTASNDVSFSVDGAAAYKAACNGDATSLVPFNSTTMPLFSGKLVAIVEGTTKGTATITASANGLQSDSLTINVE